MTNVLFDKIRSDPKYSPQNSYQWFQKKVREAFGNKQISSMQLMATAQQSLRTTILPGRMYSFVYYPKYHDNLPYYDVFPLVIPFNKNRTGFIGLNLHYLDYRYRLLLLNKLQQFAVHNRAGEVAYLRFSWNLIRNAARLPEVAPCVKRYLYGYTRSKFIQIDSNEWHIAAMLPTENFKKAKLTEVWRNTRKQITGPKTWR